MCASEARHGRGKRAKMVPARTKYRWGRGASPPTYARLWCRCACGPSSALSVAMDTLTMVTAE